MSEDLMKFDLPQVKPASIKVVGVGGGGGNAVNHMYEQGIKDVDFILCNTDAQALSESMVPLKIQIGEAKTKGRGAGNNPEVGRDSAMENMDEVKEVLADNTQMVFITAGMGGGTGTGAAPIIARASKELGILTVAIVTVPFRFEGRRRISHALEGIEQLREHVDSLLVINNEKLREMYGNLTLSDAFKRADDVLAIAAKGIAEIITVHGKVNVDFADVNTVMEDSGVAIMGSATAKGENRAIDSIEQALNSPLLNNADINGAKDILLNITSGKQEVTMDEIADITDYILDEAGVDVNMIWGSVVDPNLNDELNVTIIATGFEMDSLPGFGGKKPSKPKKVMLEEKVEEPQTVTETVIVDNTEEVVEDEFNTIDESEIQPSRDDGKEVFTLDMDDFDDSPASSRISKNTHTPQQSQIRFDEEDDDDFFEVKTPSASDKPATQSRPRSNQYSPAPQTDPNDTFSYQEVREMDDISAYENIPAFKRKKLDLEAKNKEAKGKSKYTVSEGKNGPRFRENNSFLHDNVD